MKRGNALIPDLSDRAGHLERRADAVLEHPAVLAGTLIAEQGGDGYCRASTARLLRCTRCQSMAKPSWQEYWHLSKTMMGLRRMSPQIVNGAKSWAPSTPDNSPRPDGTIGRARPRQYRAPARSNAEPCCGGQDGIVPHSGYERNDP